MEALSRLMDKAVARGFLEGFSVNSQKNTAVKVSHLFADDTLIFCEVDRD